MQKYIDDVKAFQTKFNLPVRHSLTVLTPQEAKFRLDFTAEELAELHVALLAEVKIDAIIDVAYIAVGTLLYAGMHSSNAIQVIPSLAYEVFRQNNLSDLYKDHYTMLAKSIYLPRFYNICLANINIFSTSYRLAEIFQLDFDAHWDEVHKCNMAKELCSPGHPSSRGYTDGSDLIKPEGWISPDHTKILRNS